jgi:hypothetical protein
MAFVPKPRLSADLLGLGPTPPRRVLLGGVVALSSRVVPGDIVQKALLVLAVAAAAAGAARMMRSFPLHAQLAAATMYAWNPLVYERLALGQLAFVLSYAALPWVVDGALQVRAGRRRAAARTVVAVAAAAVTGPYGGGFALVIAFVLLLAPPFREGNLRARSLAVAGAFLVNLVWIVPAVLTTVPTTSSALADRLFAARSDSPLGLAGSLLSLGGLWRTDLAPVGRHTVAWIPIFLGILVVAAAGWTLLRRTLPRGSAWALVGLAVAGFVAAGGPSFPLTGAVYRFVAEHVPGGGALRDSQKFVAPIAILLAAAFGAGVARIVAMVPPTDVGWRRAALALVALPVAMVPALGWGLSGTLFTTNYPPSWDQARRVMAADPVDGAILVLPWHLYMPFQWNRGRAVIDPALIGFTRQAVTSDALELGPYRLPPEDPWSRAMDATILDEDAQILPAAEANGFRYVLLLREADWRKYPPRLRTLPPVLDSRELTLWRLASPSPAPEFPVPPAWPIIIGDVIALVTALVALVGTRYSGWHSALVR